MAPVEASSKEKVYSNVMLANGKLFPYLEVEPRKYRLRLMNGSNARFFRLSFGNLSPMHQISSDQGLLSSPIKMKRILLAPAERADIIFDFSQQAGQNIILKSDGFDIMQFRVASTGTTDNSSLPPTLKTVPRIPESQAIKTRRLTLDKNMDKVQQSMGMMLNNTPWHMPVTEKPVINTTEIWELVNLTEDTHPIHLHLVKFQLLDRHSFDVFLYQDKDEHRPRHTRVSRRIRLEGHHPLRDRPSHSNHRPFRRLHGPLRLALPPTRTRRQRDDAPIRRH